MVTKAELLLNFPQAFVGKLSKVLLLVSVGILTASPGWAVVVAPTSLTVVVPGTAGGPEESNNTQADGSMQTYSLPSSAGINAGNTYVDDVLLQSITFSGTTFNSTNFSASQRLEVTNGRSVVRADFGQAGSEANYRSPGTSAITDTNSDGNPNPFVTAGVVAEGVRLTQAQQSNSTNTVTQDRAIQAAFDSLSISQGTRSDGNYTYKTIFDLGIVDNDIAEDQIPELIFFEGGFNTGVTVRAIIGGTFTDPEFATGTAIVPFANMTPSGIFIDTAEINAGEQLGAVGIDLNDFEVAAGQAIYGIEVSSGTQGNGGADIFGQFASASDTANFRPVPTALSGVPEPLTILGSGMALGFGALMKRQHSRKRKD